MFETKAKKGDQVIILPIHWKHELMEKNKFHHIYGTVIGHHETKNPDGSITKITEARATNGNIYNNDEKFWQERAVEIYTMNEFQDTMCLLIGATNEMLNRLKQQKTYVTNAFREHQIRLSDNIDKSGNDAEWDYDENTP